MSSSDDHRVRALWDDVQRATGARRAPWETFAAIFMTHMRRNYPAEVHRAPQEPPPEMVLRYAFDRGASARAAAGEDVKPRHLKLFLGRFGPMRTCLEKASSSLFDETGCLAPWFHGMMSREEATRAMDEWDVSHRMNGRMSHPTVGAFLFRYSASQPSITLTYRLSVTEVKHCLIMNNGRDGYVLPEMTQTWRNLREFVSDQGRTFVHPVTSALYLECKKEIEGSPHEPPDLPPVEETDPQALYIRAKTIACSDLGHGYEATRLLEEALSLSHTALATLRASEPRDPKLEAKVLRQEGDILWKLRREDEGVESYVRCLDVVRDAQEIQEESPDASNPLVIASILRHVHEVLTSYYLRSRLHDQALHHFSELVACTTDEDMRQHLMHEFQHMTEFREVTNHLTLCNVEEMLQEGIKYFVRNEFEPASNMFSRALRDARCIGERKLEARALGNVATIDYKLKNFRAAIPRYRTCVQLLRQLKDLATERKILNYLVICCIEARRWTTAKRFHEQLLQLAESEDNISFLRRLELQIEEGMEQENLEFDPTRSR